MNIRAHFIVICLAVVLVLTGQSMAAARGAADATGKMVLCVGTQSVVVYMDEQGQPVQAPEPYGWRTNGDGCFTFNSCSLSIYYNVLRFCP